MSAISRRADPRVLRSRVAVVQAATALFLQQGYAGTTMEQIALAAGLTKRTVYNNYGGKEALFRQIVAEVIGFAEAFAQELRTGFADLVAEDPAAALHDLGRRLALAILRPEVIALRRLLIGEARTFPELATEYFDRAPRRVLATLAVGFTRMRRAGRLRMTSPRQAAEQFAYLIVGEPLDRAMLVGKLPSRRHVLGCARVGVDTFLARYAVPAS